MSIASRGVQQPPLFPGKGLVGSILQLSCRLVTSAHSWFSLWAPAEMKVILSRYNKSNVF